MKKMIMVVLVGCMFLTGCKSMVPASHAEESESMELSEGIGDIEDIGIKELTDNWPESFCYNGEGVSGYPLCAEIEIDTPTSLSISAVTWEGSLRFKIMDADMKEICFDENNPDGEYTVEIEKAGTYQLLFCAKEHVGSVEIIPDKK